MTTTPPPRAAGKVRVNENWSMVLPSPFNQKIEDGTLVLWDDTLTIWIKSYGNTDGLSKQARVDREVANADPSATEMIPVVAHGLGRCSYRLNEKGPAGVSREALYTYTHSDAGQLNVAFYSFDEKQIPRARVIYASIEAETP